jgi:hypothetical protein
MKMPAKLPHVYIYLDREGIDSLYAQTVDQIVLEMTNSKEQQQAGKVGTKLSLGGMLAKLLGIGELSGEGEASLSRIRVEETKATLVVEHKLANLLSYLEGFDGSGFTRNIETAAELCLAGNTPTFVLAQDSFNLPQFYVGNSGVDAVNKAGHVFFEIGAPLSGDMFQLAANYDPSDDYYKNAKRARVVMSAGLPKFTRIGTNGSMGRLSHDAMFFGGHRGRGVQLGVFGSMAAYQNLFCQLKPYALWL